MTPDFVTVADGQWVLHFGHLPEESDTSDCKTYDPTTAQASATADGWENVTFAGDGTTTAYTCTVTYSDG